MYLNQRLMFQLYMTFTVSYAVATAIMYNVCCIGGAVIPEVFVTRAVLLFESI